MNGLDISLSAYCVSGTTLRLPFKYFIFSHRITIKLRTVMPNLEVKGQRLRAVL